MARSFQVTRIQDGRRSYITPPCDESWPPMDKLRWHAAVVEHDTGLRVAVHRHDDHPPPNISIQVGASSLANFTHSSAWTFLNGVSAGAEASRPRKRTATN